jgi:hypothetical protein
VAIAYSPLHSVCGASGALCGIFGAEAVWVLLYGRYLPRDLGRRGRSQVVVNLLLLVFISLAPGVSWGGHLGGGVAGAVAALVLHFQRFGPPAVRWLAVLALLPLPWVGVQLLQRQRATSPQWHRIEALVYLASFGPQADTPVRAVLGKAQDVHDTTTGLLRFLFSRRDPAQVEQALAALKEQEQALDALAARLARAGPYRAEKVERQRQADLEKTRALAEKIAAARSRLEQDADKRRRLEEKEEGDFEKTSLPRIHKTTTAAEALHKREVQPLLRQRPARRDAGAVARTQRALAKQQKALTALAERLAEVGPFVSETAEEARSTAREYLGAQVEQLDLARRALTAGTGWTDRDRDELRRQEREVVRLRGKWQKLLEK